jgi:hypothetical protein
MFPRSRQANESAIAKPETRAYSPMFWKSMPALFLEALGRFLLKAAFFLPDKRKILFRAQNH